MATSDELLSALENIAIDYDKSPANDDLPYAPNWHYDMLRAVQGIEYNLRIYNEMYRQKNGISITTTNS